MPDYLIIGNGVAGTTAAENIRKQDTHGSITILTDETLPFYSRIRLIDYLAGTVDEEKLLIKKSTWYETQQISLETGVQVTGADGKKKQLSLAGGRNIDFDKLLLATGSHAFLPPIAGSDIPGVFTLRTIADAKAIVAYAEKVDTVIMVGGGLLGLEAGHSLLKRGKKVVVVEFFPRLLPRQLDNKGAKRLREIMEQMGFSFHLDAMTKRISGTDRVEGICLEKGTEIQGQMVVVSAGVRPNLDLAKQLGLTCDKGIIVDDMLETSVPGIYAAGDVVQHQEMLYGIWPAAMQQGKIAGINMAGGESLYQGTTMSNQLKVAGIDLAAAGEIDAEGRFEAKVVSSGAVYKKLVLDQHRIIGCIMLGDTTGFNTVTRYITEGLEAGDIKNTILNS